MPFRAAHQTPLLFDFKPNNKSHNNLKMTPSTEASSAGMSAPPLPLKPPATIVRPPPTLPSSKLSTNTPLSPFLPEIRQSRFEQAVALTLNLWPALTLAVQNNWGGPDSADKRDWLAGQVADQFPSLAACSSSTATSSTTTSTNNSSTAADDDEPDAEYIEELLLQVMLDEFEVNVDDESAYDVATEIVRLRGQCARGTFDEVDRLRARWEGRRGVRVVMEEGEDQDGDTDWDDTDGEDDGDEEMGEAPALVPAVPKKEKKEPEVDEDGFTTVTRKR